MAAETESYRLELARERIKENPSAVDAWSVLLSDAKKRSVDDTRDFFESLVSQFPTCGRYWKSYIEAELTAKNFEFVEKLFHRCLMNVPHVELWMCYLKYLTENKSSIRNFRQIIIDAYEFALQKLGRNPFSTPIWIAYIDFLNISISSPNEFHKIREVYGDALSTPLIGIEQLWDTFCRFEMSISGSIDVMNTKIDEHARTYEKMKRAAHEIERMLRTIEIGGPSTAPAWTSNSSQIVKRWQTYIDWEKSNPLRLSDNKTLAERVMHAYEQCLLSLGYHVEIWYEFAEYLLEVFESEKDIDYVNKARKQYELALSTYLQDSALVHFALADLEESQNNMSAAEAVYERYIDKRSIDPTLAYIMLMRFICRRDGVVNAREVFRRARDDRRCSCHIYEAAAEMEFQCNPENGHEVGCKVIDLGLAKHSNNPKYVLTCLEMMMNLNEDESGTRILFEKTISSPVFSNQNDQHTKYLWEIYLKFETQRGDLSSVLKVENARKDAIRASATSGTSIGSLGTTSLVERFKFLGLECVTDEEKRSFDYTQVASDPLTESFDLDTTIRIPHTESALPYKPTKLHLAGWHTTPGGIFPFPSALADLAKRLPPPYSFEGPFVIVDKLIEYLNDIELPEVFDPHFVTIAGEPISRSEFYNLTHVRVTSNGAIRRIGRIDDDIGFRGIHRAPENDIFRLRRMEDEFGWKKKATRPAAVHLLEVQHSVLPDQEESENMDQE